MTGRLEAADRRAAVLAVYDALGVGDLDDDGDGDGDGDVLEGLFLPDAHHHGPSDRALPAGPAGARELYRELRTRLPGAVAAVKRSAVDGDHVAVHWHASADPTDESSGEAWCEFFRFDGDRVAEHWQLHVDVPASTVSGRSVFSDAHPLAAAQGQGDPAVAAANRELAAAAFARFLRFDPGVVADHWGEVYLQHNETIPDGPDGLRRSLEEVGALPAGSRPVFEVAVTVAEDDLVWFLEHVRVGDRTGLGVDVFRLVDGRVVEHWDVPALRPGPDRPER